MGLSRLTSGQDWVQFEGLNHTDSVLMTGSLAMKAFPFVAFLQSAPSQSASAKQNYKSRCFCICGRPAMSPKCRHVGFLWVFALFCGKQLKPKARQQSSITGVSCLARPPSSATDLAFSSASLRILVAFSLVSFPQGYAKRTLFENLSSTSAKRTRLSSCLCGAPPQKVILQSRGLEDRHLPTGSNIGCRHPAKWGKRPLRHI